MLKPIPAFTKQRSRAIVGVIDSDLILSGIEQMSAREPFEWFVVEKPMPRSKTNASTSNLSVILPRNTHRKAKVNFYRSGLNISFGAYVAWCLERVPEQLDDEAKMDLRLMELKIRCLMPSKL